MNRRIQAVVLLLMSAALLSGCWDRREAEELLLVDAMAVDIILKEGLQYYQITLVSAKPTGGGTDQMGMGTGGGGGGGAVTQWIASSTGRTLEEAMINFSARAPRYIYLEHNTIILVGEEMARAGVSELLDYFVRKQQVRLRNFIFVTRGNALELFSAAPEFEDQLAREMQGILDRGGKEGDYFLYNDLNIFSQSVLTPGQDPWAPVVHTFQPTETEEAMEDTAVKIEGTALFRSDKLAGFLSKQETQGFKILRDMAARGGYYTSFRGGPVSFIYDEVDVRRDLIQRGNKWEVNYQVAIHGTIKEIHAASTFSDQDLKAMERLLGDTAKKNLEQTIVKCQQLGVDVLGIGREIHIQHPELWKNYHKKWREMYQDIKITANVSVEITGTNLGLKSITPKEE